jgi:IS1 family transposase
MLHADLQPFRKTHYIGRINRAFKPVARELKKAGASALSLDLVSNKDASPLRDLLTIRWSYDANQWLRARATACDFQFVLTLPFRNGVTLPYALEIYLDSRAPVRASLGAWWNRRGRWFTDPPSRKSARRLQALRLPGVGWVHASGGFKHSLQSGGAILPADTSGETNRWIVQSAYQGFLIRVGPRVVKYLRAAARLQNLRHWSPSVWDSRSAAKPLGDLRTSMKDATLALSMLLEGMSIRSVQRLTGLCRQTLADLILLVGENCERLLKETVRAVPVKDVQIDEIWSFVGMKEKARVAGDYPREFGDSWTFIGIERDTKLILAHEVGQRDTETCCKFLDKLNVAAAGRFQVTSDGLRAYTLNVPFILGSRVDFAQLIKNYSSSQEQTRYSPARIISADKVPQFGNPDEDRISTSHIERLNLTLRMTLRRFTRLTNGHSKSLKHHAAMQSIFVAWYNFGRKHEALKGSIPAMASGLADKVWSVKELIERAAVA